mmetsp:Transcript_55691/g.162858  ORF Transcript_55691/g.162858 Transcript_55691/m.162858 type:complete len:249 (+) Transcript_55691:991-1737(+)
MHGESLQQVAKVKEHGQCIHITGDFLLQQNPIEYDRVEEEQHHIIQGGDHGEVAGSRGREHLHQVGQGPQPDQAPQEHAVGVIVSGPDLQGDKCEVRGEVRVVADRRSEHYLMAGDRASSLGEQLLNRHVWVWVGSPDLFHDFLKVVACDKTFAVNLHRHDHRNEQGRTLESVALSKQVQGSSINEVLAEVFEPRRCSIVLPGLQRISPSHHMEHLSRAQGKQDGPSSTWCDVLQKLRSHHAPSDDGR